MWQEQTIGVEEQEIIVVATIKIVLYHVRTEQVARMNQRHRLTCHRIAEGHFEVTRVRYLIVHDAGQRVERPVHAVVDQVNARVIFFALAAA